MILIDDTPISKWKVFPIGQSVNPMTADFKNKLLEIPGMTGAWDFGTETGTKPFDIPLVIKEKDVIERQRLLREFVAFLMDDYGRPRECKLMFDYEPDKFYHVKLNGRIQPERLYGLTKFELSFLATKPHAKFIVPSTDISWGSDIPIMSDVLWDLDKTEHKITTKKTISIVNSGNIAIRIGFTLKGSGRNVTVSGNGKTMTFGTMSNSNYEVDGQHFSIKKNGIEDLLTTNFIELFPGNNSITISGTNMNLTFTEKLTYEYL